MTWVICGVPCDPCGVPCDPCGSVGVTESVCWQSSPAAGPPCAQIVARIQSLENENKELRKGNGTTVCCFNRLKARILKKWQQKWLVLNVLIPIWFVSKYFITLKQENYYLTFVKHVKTSQPLVIQYIFHFVNCEYMFYCVSFSDTRLAGSGQKAWQSCVGTRGQQWFQQCPASQGEFTWDVTVASYIYVFLLAAIFLKLCLTKCS